MRTLPLDPDQLYWTRNRGLKDIVYAVGQRTATFDMFSSPRHIVINGSYQQFAVVRVYWISRHRTVNYSELRLPEYNVRSAGQSPRSQCEQAATISIASIISKASVLLLHQLIRTMTPYVKAMSTSAWCVSVKRSLRDMLHQMSLVVPQGFLCITRTPSSRSSSVLSNPRLRRYLQSE